MKVQTLQAKLEKHTDAIRALVEEQMKEEGLVESDSQRVCVLNALSSLEMNINGIEQSDLKSK